MIAANIALCSNAQDIASKCTGPDAVKSLYFTDAQGLALKRILELNSVYKDSVAIHPTSTDSIMRALMAVYNATSLPERDTVVNLYRIHCYPYQALNSSAILADKTLPWVIDMKNDIFPTSNAAVNTLMTKYRLHKSYYTEWGDALIFFKSDSNLNRVALVQEWSAITPVRTEPYLNSVAGDGSMIYVDTVTPTYTQLRYEYRCGDCPAGCIYRRAWQFKVWKDCSVTYIGSYGDDLSASGCEPLPSDPTEIIPIAVKDISVYPNPFSDIITISDLTGKTKYSLVNTLGVVLSSGEIDKDSDISLKGIASGIYWLNLVSSEQVKTLKMIKL